MTISESRSSLKVCLPYLNAKPQSCEKPYNEGVLERCSEERSKEKLSKTRDRAAIPEDTYVEVAHRLTLSLSGPVHDIFAVGVC